MKKLSELLQAIQYKEIIGSEEVMISQIEFDSRKIKKEESHTANGIIYVAQRGLNVDGHDFIDAAIANGASVIVVETLPENLQNNVTYIKVDNSSVVLGRLASAFYDFPSQKIKLVGITGTNGKTTIATLLHKLFIDLGYPTGLISTITNIIINKEFPTTYTTPDALQLNKLLSEMVNAGCEFCFMEVSSHAVCQHRIEGVEYICGVFTNITHDHLDFHKT
ncbi:MAG TPA: Mur ligase family protein, partial [Bacteroidales bacterium]|nr:Mur ligase family protein [Bacteroidales bacterium]